MPRLFLGLCLILCSSSTLFAAPEFRAGVYAIDITPEKYPVIVNCYFNERIATSAQDRLHARCTVLDDGKERVAIVIVDSCMLPREFLDSTKRQIREMTGIAENRQLIAATHTHSAPAVMGCLGTDPDPHYPLFLQTQIVRGVSKAVELLKPAQIGWTIAQAPNHTYNRRWILRADKVRNDPFGQATVRANMHPGYQSADFIGPSGPTDPALSMLALRTPDGKPLAIWCNYSMHYFGSGIVSSDYFGLFATQLLKKAGSTPDTTMVTMSQGTSGDLMWMDYAQAKPWTNLNDYADSLATIAHTAWKDIRYVDHVSLAMAEDTIKLKRRVPNEARLEWAKMIQTAQKTAKPQSQPEIYAREAMYLHAEPERELKLQAIRIGDFAIAAIPNEVFAITGLKIKAASPLTATCVVELANGADGYIPPPEQHHLGGYTTWPARSAGLEVQAEPQIVERIVKLLETVSGRERKPNIEPETDYSGGIRALKPYFQIGFGQLSGTKLYDDEGRLVGEIEPGYAFALPGPLEPNSFYKKNHALQLAGGKVRLKNFDRPNSFSVSMWVWNGYPLDVREKVGTILSMDKFSLGIAGKGESAGRLSINDKPVGKQPLGLRRWHHLLIDFEPNQVTVFIDGTLDFTAAPGPIGGPMILGAKSDGTDGLEGRIDEFALFLGLLSERERKGVFPTPPATEK